MNIAIIPARGGSKRIPKKNIRHFSGKPIIGYSIEAALNTGLFSSVIVSTDDMEIAKVAKDFGAEVPFMRPTELSDDITGTTPVIRHALEWCLKDNRDIQKVCGIYATAPFVTASFIKQGYAALSHAPAAFSITTFPYPVYRGLSRSKDNRMSLLWPENLMSRSQDLPEVYHDCGQFYWATTDFLLDKNEFMNGEAIGISIPRHRVQDIDTEEDWIRAEAMFQALKETQELC